MAEEPTAPIPSRPKDQAEPSGAAAPADGDNKKGPSKKELKKLEKEKEKAEKKRQRDEQEAAAKAAADATDVSKGDYGLAPVIGYAPYAPFAGDYIGFEALGGVADGTEVAIRCDVQNARTQSAKLAFLELRERSHTIQAVVAASETLSRQMVKFAAGINPESVVDVIGLVREPREAVKSASIADREVHVHRIYVVGPAQAQLPIQIEDANGALPAEEGGGGGASGDEGARPSLGLNVRLDNRVLDLRAPINHAIMVIKDGVDRLFTDFMRAHGFTKIHTPKIVAAATEGGATVFEVKYFDKKGYLAQSPQFYKQMAVSARHPRVFEIGPVFRAENSNTNRHLTEFTGLDIEMTFKKDYHEVLDMLLDMMLYILHGLRERYGTEVELVRKVYKVDEFKIPARGQVPILPFLEGVRMLRAAGVELDDYEDLSTPHEKLLGRLVLEKYGSDFYVLDQFPLAARPFYTMPSAADPDRLSNSYDLFMRGQEIMSGAQRVHDFDLLCQRMRSPQHGLDPEAEGFRFYLEAFKNGCAPHGGGGFGLERIVMLWLGLPNVRLASMFPRDPVRFVP